jgi:hypothetical protein
MTVRKKQMPPMLVHFSRPTGAIIGTQDEHGTSAKTIGLNISIAGKDRLWIFVLGSASDEIADVIVPEAEKIIRRQTRVRGADENLRSVELSRHGLEVPEGKIDLTAKVGGQPHELERAAIVRGNLHWESPLMVMREHVEGEPLLFQVADALGSFGFEFRSDESGQEQRSQNGDDCHHQ